MEQDKILALEVAEVLVGVLVPVPAIMRAVQEILHLQPLHREIVVGQVLDMEVIMLLAVEAELVVQD